LRQRIAVQARLDALPAAEVGLYISHRLQIAAYRGTALFTPGALGLITERSRGIPRLINNLCFNALSLGCAMQRKQITAEIVREAAADLSLETHTPPAPAPQQKAGRDIIRDPRPARESVYSRMRDNFLGRRLFQKSRVS
jgi:hypothetical protein